MKKLITILAIFGILICLAGCKEGGGNAATPGDLVTNSPHVLHTDGDTTDVSADYFKRLCTYAWLDTTDMSYIKLAEDGTFFCAAEEDLEEHSAEGTWTMRKDAEGHLSLRIEKASEAPYTLYDVELYDQSLFGYGEDGFNFIWLLCDPET